MSNGHFEADVSRIKGEHVDGAASAAHDFFARADNTAADLDPRPGFVRLSQQPAPGLLERETETVSGTQNPDGSMTVTGGDQSSLSVSPGGKEVAMQRPAYQNDNYMPTLEQLTRNDDGTRTITWNYSSL